MENVLVSSERPKLGPDVPKVVTAWLSVSGRVVYLTKDRSWSESLGDAEVMTGLGANDVLAWAAQDQTRVSDPYFMQVVQWPDRIVFRYEKDDAMRTVWLDGRKPTVQDYSLQGFSVGRYEGNALIVDTDHFLFDITGFDDYNGIPSSTLKKVTEKYWKENGELKMTLTLEDPLFLRKPASYTTRWLAAAPGYQLEPWECDPESARAPIKMMIPKYK